MPSQKNSFLLLTLFSVFLVTVVSAQIPGTKEGRTLLPNGWWLSPYGTHQPLHDFPMNAALTQNERMLAVLHCGHSAPRIMLFDTKSMTLRQTVMIKDAWYGISFEGKKLYVSGGNLNLVYVFALQADTLAPIDTLRLDVPKGKFIGAVAGLDVYKGTLAVVMRNDSSLRYIRLSDKKETKVALRAMPYAATYLPDGKLLVSLWNGKAVQMFDGVVMKTEFPTGDHPNEVTLSANGREAYVSNANDNTVSVIDLVAKKTSVSVVTSLYPDAPEGSTTNSTALSPDGKFLLAANADNNSLTVVSLANKKQPTPVGFIPVGWYPTKVLILKNKTVLVVNGKGDRSAANPKREYIGGLLHGTLSTFPFPDGKKLVDLTKSVYANTPFEPKQMTVAPTTIGETAIPKKVGDPSPIKYIFYIIKENRTYDQVFGDIPGGNGDSSLTIFGEQITPNLHKLVKSFVLFDNFYVNAEVSADGHNWTDGAYASDYIEKTWPGQYGGRGGEYDFDGIQPGARPASGYIWDLCQRHGVTYRSYGEFVRNGKTDKDSATTWEPSLKGNIAPFYRGWDMSYSDIDRVKAWMKEFDAYDANGGLPQFNVMVLPNDHTSGTGKNQLTPQAFVAQNDYAVGLMIERLSKSRYWKESAVFIVEDDAQNGPDHVDAHRSTAVVVSPYLKRNFVDHALYSTASMLRTMELILGLPPMSQYDAAAQPMFAAFSNHADTTSYTAEPPRYDITRKNKDGAFGQRLIDRMNFTKVDAVPDRLFNEIIWRSIKGTQMPPPKYSILSGIPRNEEEEDEE